MIKLDFFDRSAIFAAIMKFLFCMTAFIALLLAPNAWAQAVVLPQDQSSAVIFVYYRVGEDQFPGASIRMEQFSAHIRELKSGKYNILALPDVVSALKNGSSLPDRTIALTFDGGYKSLLLNAIPLLLENGIPFTVFVSTDYLDRGSGEYMNWADLKKLAKNRLVTIGLHPASYTHLADSGKEDMMRGINNAVSRMREMTGLEPKLFAYPFGEYSTVFRNAIAAAGFDAAFGQQSGVAYAGQDMLTLPRFPMTESFGDTERFQMTASALPLPVSDTQPKDPRLDTSHPVIGFTVGDPLKKALKSLSCFASGQEGKAHAEFPGGGRVELRLDASFDEDKARINCTMPGPPGEPDDPPRWRWFGMLMTLPSADREQEGQQLQTEARYQ